MIIYSISVKPQSVWFKHWFDPMQVKFKIQGNACKKKNHINTVHFVLFYYVYYYSFSLKCGWIGLLNVSSSHQDT